MMQGVDVSAFQGTAIDWKAVAHAGAAFAFCKCSEGSTYTDPTFIANWDGIKAAGLVRGTYHFARPDLNPPEAEADHFISRFGPLSAGDLLVLDIEVGQGDLSGWCLRWLARVAGHFGFNPLVYTGGWFAAGRLTAPALGQYPLWNSAYTAVMPPPYAPWPLVSFWQYTDSAYWPGIGRCDSSYFLGDVGQLAKLGKPGPAPTPPVTTWPTVPKGGTYIVAVQGGDGATTHLRTAPRLDAPEAATVKTGDKLTATGGWTTSWRECTTADGHQGWCFAGNLKAA
jgi:lysozyme